MSDRRRRSHEDYYTREPVVIERKPQVREYRTIRKKSPERNRLTVGAKLYNLFRSRKRRVQIIEEVPVRSRHQERHSQSPPSSPRGPYHTMAVDPEDDIFTPLPPKLPSKPKDEPKRYILGERSPQRYHKVKVVHERFDDDDAHPRVESASPPRSKRDSGKYYMTGARVEDSHNRPHKEYERVRPVSDPEVARLKEDIERLRLERREAELAAAAATDNVERLKADLEYEKRQRSLEKRERAIAEREKSLGQQRNQLVEVRRPRERQEMVVVHNPPTAVVPIRDPNRSALDRAREDYQRGTQADNARRIAAGGRTSRRERILIVDDAPEDQGGRQRRL